MGGPADGLAYADPGVRTPIGVSGNFVFFADTCTSSRVDWLGHTSAETWARTLIGVSGIYEKIGITNNWKFAFYDIFYLFFGCWPQKWLETLNLWYVILRQWHKPINGKYVILWQRHQPIRVWVWRLKQSNPLAQLCMVSLRKYEKVQFRSYFYIYHISIKLCEGLSKVGHPVGMAWLHQCNNLV